MPETTVTKPSDSFRRRASDRADLRLRFDADTGKLVIKSTIPATYSTDVDFDIKIGDRAYGTFTVRLGPQGRGALVFEQTKPRGVAYKVKASNETPFTKPQRASFIY